VSDLERESIELLQQLIRHNTVNPPGGERFAMQELHDLLADAGFECEMLASEPDRPNVIARLPGKADGPTLGYLGHVDTVLANPSEWEHDPWSGDLADGFIWGRGAVDMKSQVAAEVAAAVALARSGWRPARGELKVMCVVDEETGGRHGAQFLTEQHPDLVRCDWLINEGGGATMRYGDQRFYTLGCAEKGVFRFSLITEGVAGHGSMPRVGDNALLKMAPILERFGSRTPPLHPTDEPIALIEELGLDSGDPGRTLELVAEQEPALAIALEATLGVTFAPTKISASEKVNVIPSRAVLDVDCRVPPGLGEAEVRAALDAVLDGIDGWRIEFHDPVPGNRSSRGNDLHLAIDEWIAENDPGAITAPSVLPGFTDSRWFRAAFPECVAYGFFPQKHMTVPEVAVLMHGANERIDVRDLAFATKFFHDLPPRLLG
jgi:acetylornithine deacetylase/succinyl-diaminopimelate desuccinylase-like protein